MKNSLIFTKAEPSKKLTFTAIEFNELQIQKGQLKDILPFSIMYKIPLKNTGNIITYNEHTSSFDALEYFDSNHIKNKPVRRIGLKNAKIIFESSFELEIKANYKTEEDFRLLFNVEIR